MLLPGLGDHHEQLRARLQLRQTTLEVTTKRVQLRRRQKSVISSRDGWSRSPVCFANECSPVRLAVISVRVIALSGAAST